MSQKPARPSDPASEGAPPAKSREETKPREDVVLIQGVSSDGQALAVLRARNDRVEAGIVRAVKQGEPIHGELVRLKPRAESPLLCDVEVDVPEGTINALGGSEHARPSHGGPAQVATTSYRANWDAIWSNGAGKKSMPN